jgi:hypothetical protein
MFEIQIECRIRDCEIDAESAIVLGSQAKLVNRNRAQERCIDLVDINREPLLARSPPNPPANAMGNCEWSKPDRQQRREQEKQSNEEKSIFQGHLDRCRNDEARITSSERSPKD